jgi:Holliday junction resolvasome RuvABC endonuclease subunit
VVQRGERVIVIGIDPSSTIVGYAVFRAMVTTGEIMLVDAGRLRPSGEFPVNMPASLREWLSTPEMLAYRRLWSLREEVQDLLVEYLPERVPGRIVVEVPSGKIGTGARKGARGSLTIYGMAAGVVPVTERQWTAGQGSKGRRQMGMAALYRGRYEPKTDPGGDASDAMGIARWWINQRMNQELEVCECKP